MKEYNQPTVVITDHTEWIVDPHLVSVECL